VLLFGCVTTDEDSLGYNFTPSNIIEKKDKTFLTNIDHVYVGMSMQEVDSIMGKELETGYIIKESAENVFVPITIKSPYQKEVVKKEGQRYFVHYYVTHITKPDGKISDDELTPLIFQGDKLIGKGKDFLRKIKAQS